MLIGVIHRRVALSTRYLTGTTTAEKAGKRKTGEKKKLNQSRECFVPMTQCCCVNGSANAHLEAEHAAPRAQIGRQKDRMRCRQMERKTELWRAPGTHTHTHTHHKNTQARVTR